MGKAEKAAGEEARKGARNEAGMGVLFDIMDIDKTGKIPKGGLVTPFSTPSQP